MDASGRRTSNVKKNVKLLNNGPGTTFYTGKTTASGQRASTTSPGHLPDRNTRNSSEIPFTRTISFSSYSPTFQSSQQYQFQAQQNQAQPRHHSLKIQPNSFGKFPFVPHQPINYNGSNSNTSNTNHHTSSSPSTREPGRGSLTAPSFIPLKSEDLKTVNSQKYDVGGNPKEATTPPVNMLTSPPSGNFPEASPEKQHMEPSVRSKCCANLNTILRAYHQCGFFGGTARFDSSSTIYSRTLGSTTNYFTNSDTCLLLCLPSDLGVIQRR